LVVSIGALIQVSKIQASAERGSLTRQSYEYGLRQYDSALRGMREAIVENKHDVRHALIACLLVFVSVRSCNLINYRLFYEALRIDLVIFKFHMLCHYLQ
jgi:hypothetical protein